MRNGSGTWAVAWGVAALLGSSAEAGTVSLAPSADTRVLSVAPSLNEGSATLLSVFDADGNTQRSLLLFDLSSIPSGQVIISATLVLSASIAHGSNPSGRPMDLYRVGSSWVEAEATWSDRSTGSPWTVPGIAGDAFGTTGVPGVSPYATSTANPSASGQTGTRDSTQMVQEWYSGSHANFGMLLLSSSVNRLTFDSREGSISPVLRVTFEAPVPAASWLGFGLFAGVGGIAWVKRRRTTPQTSS